MKKLIIAFVALLLSSGSLFSQYALPKGSAQLNAGFGLEEYGLPIYIGFDYGVHKDISIGAEVSFRNYNQYGFKYNIIGISGNFNYHLNYLLGLSRDWDIYAGVNLGYFYYNYPDDWNSSKSSPLGLRGQLGFRYYFTPKFGINLEFGGGNAFNGGKLGATIKL